MLLVKSRVGQVVGQVAKSSRPVIHGSGAFGGWKLVGNPPLNVVLISMNSRSRRLGMADREDLPCPTGSTRLPWPAGACTFSRGAIAVSYGRTPNRIDEARTRLSKSKLLIAVSSPWAAEKLTGPIADLARRLDAEVLVAHVAQLHDEDENESDAKQRGEQTLKLITDGLKQVGVRTEGLMLFADDVAKAILNTAKARSCTMIILGLTGKGVFKRLIAGDVPGNIIRQADMPVLLCPANWVGML